MVLRAFGTMLKLFLAVGTVFGVLSAGVLAGVAVHPGVSLTDGGLDGQGTAGAVPATNPTAAGTPASDPAGRSGTVTVTVTAAGSRSTAAAPTATPELGDSDGPRAYVLNRRIDPDTYEWDRRTDPDDPGPTDARTDAARIDSEDVEYYVFQRVNEIRTERGLRPFDYTAYFSSVSRAHSEDMHDRNFFAHENPDGERAWDRFGDDWGDACDTAGENLAETWVGTSVNRPDGSGTTTYTTEEELANGLVSQWMHSPPHRELMLRENVEALGVGVHLGERSGETVVHATQGFCFSPSPVDGA